MVMNFGSRLNKIKDTSSRDSCAVEAELTIKPRTRWKDYIPHMTWKHIRILQEELEEVATEEDVWATLLSLFLL